MSSFKFFFFWGGGGGRDRLDFSVSDLFWWVVEGVTLLDFMHLFIFID